jgi:hypothetical protein
MKQGYTHISVVLDESGSMGSLFNDTVGGYNKFLESQKEAPGTATWSLTAFNGSVRLIDSFRDINDTPNLGPATYKPGGGTALYDAIGATIVGCGVKLADMYEADRPEKVIMVILTDGEENSSREFSYERIQDMIKEQSEKYTWEFIFLGANLDAVAIGTGLGIKGGMSMTFAANGQGVGATFNSMSANLTNYRSMSKADTLSTAYTFFDQGDRDQQAQAGA